MAAKGGWIRVRGARVHNLYNLDVDLPQGRMTVLTGPSGSGKSSLAFDTLYAEGQRRYLETLRVDTRALFDQLQRPDVDLVEGLPPTLCVSQQAGRGRRRSTMATLTEIHDHFRLLWARLGTPHCPQCGQAIVKQTSAEIVRHTLTLGEGRKVYLLAPLVHEAKGDHKEVFARIRQAGFLRARVDGVLAEIRDNPPLNPKKNHAIDVVVDRLVIRGGIQERLTESLQSAIHLGEGTVIVTDIEDGDWHDQRFSTRNACSRCGTRMGDLEPRSFSFNNPYGACPACSGLGYVDAKTTAPVENDKASELAFSVSSVPANAKRKLDESDEDEEPPSVDVTPCPECQGTRLNRETRSVRFAGKGIHEVSALSVSEARAFFQSLTPTKKSADGDDQIRKVVLHEILERLRFLEEVGLGYLTLDRPAPTLSGGEAQRARLASHLGGGLLGVCYILDEPTIGLHPRDTGRLLDALRALEQRGNTLIVVEHDETVMRQADYLIDMGPGAGKNGGRVLASGTVAEVLANPASVTAPFLNGLCLASEKSSPNAERKQEEKGTLTIGGARHHNLKKIDVVIPLGRLVCVTGVSGSGKSSLARDILCHAARKRLGLQAPTPGEHDGIDGLEQIDKVIEVDQTPLGRSSRSNPATYTGLYDEIRKVFAGTRLAKVRGYKANRFSFNVRGGRCEECLGQGNIRVALQFLPDLTVPCRLCRGRRFNRPTLEITYKNKSIADVLDLPVADALEFFQNIPALVRPLRALVDVGLGYLTLGQPSSALSGGEAQRVKLAAELARSTTGNTLFLLDEPTTGLHFSDVATLLGVLRRLVEAGNTLVVIEHHLDVIAAADWIIDLGLEGGAAGGYLICAGSPHEVASCPDSITGRFLRERFS
jgi:excinuclease ABC subunit A